MDYQLQLDFGYNLMDIIRVIDIDEAKMRLQLALPNLEKRLYELKQSKEVSKDLLDSIITI